jgi:glutamate-5-semialdehyde dehydrogenase
MAEGLRAAGLPEAAIQVVPTTDRAAVGLLLTGLNGTSISSSRAAARASRARAWRKRVFPCSPISKASATSTFTTHADPVKAREIARQRQDAAHQRVRRAETLLIDRAVLATTGRAALEALAKAGCEIRGDDAVRATLPQAKPATTEDWSREYLDSIIAAKVVDGVDDAVRHIETYGSQHTDSIVTEDACRGGALPETPRLGHRAVERIDTIRGRAEFGMGAEIGIGTGKLHARGPVGVEQLTTFKYVVRGTGQVRP